MPTGNLTSAPVSLYTIQPVPGPCERKRAGSVASLGGRISGQSGSPGSRFPRVSGTFWGKGSFGGNRGGRFLSGRRADPAVDTRRQRMDSCAP